MASLVMRAPQSVPRTPGSTRTLGQGTEIPLVSEPVAERIAGTLNLAEVLVFITSALVEDFDAALARIWLVEGDQLVLRASSGLSTRLDGSYARVPRSGHVKIAVIARTETPHCTNAASADPHLVDKTWLSDEHIVAFTGHPLICRGVLLGVLAIFARRELSNEELKGMARFARWAAIAVQNARLFSEVDALRARLASENAYLRETEPTKIIGQSAALRTALDAIQHVAATDTTVLLLGETGTGKELFARAIHEASPRKHRALVKLNCAAVPTSLVESELFGHEKGAFTSADKRRLGRFEVADGGTLFLDEIGELPAEVQPKLLRVLQEREIERVGATSPIAVDVRVIAATNRDLREDVRKGRFRADLFYRIAVFPIEMPPLRARREDIPLLVEASIRHQARRLGKHLEGVTPNALARLIAYDWPGNVRELQNVIERAAILARGPLIGVELIPELARSEAPAPGPLPRSLVDVEREHIARVLAESDWVIEGEGGAAAFLGIRPSTLRSRMVKLGIRRPR